MNINYIENDRPEYQQLLSLYADVGWVSYVNNPEKLSKIIEHSLFNIAAYANNELVGLIRVVGDGVSICYIQDLLVKEAYQRKGIGGALITKIIERYANIRQIVLMTEDTEKTKAFYKSQGLTLSSDFGGIAFVRYNFDV